MHIWISAQHPSQDTELLQWILPMKLKDQMSQIHCPQLRLATCFFLFCFISPPPSFTYKVHQSVFVPHNELLWPARPIHIPYIFNLFQKNDTLQRPCKCVVLVMSVDKTVDVLSLMAKSINLARSCVYPCPPGHPHPMRIRRPLHCRRHGGNDTIHNVNFEEEGGSIYKHSLTFSFRPII